MAKIYKITLNELRKLMEGPKIKSKIDDNVYQPLKEFLSDWYNNDQKMKTWDDNFLNIRGGLQWFANVTGYNARDFAEDSGWLWDVTKDFLNDDIYFLPIKQQKMIYNVFTGKEQLSKIKHLF